MKHKFQCNQCCVNDLFTCVWEHHRDQFARAGLHLTGSPVRLRRAFHQHAGFQNQMNTHGRENAAGGGEGKADLAGLVAARICHDLASPLGAIGNGVELLHMMIGGTAAEAEFDLLDRSVSSAHAQMRVLRLAFGDDSGNKPTARSQSDLADALGRIVRFRLDWGITEPLGSGDLRLLALLVLCLQSALAWGGHVRVTSAGRMLQLHAQADRIRWDANLWDLLVNPVENVGISARDVHFPVAGQVLARRGVVPEFRRNAQLLVLSWPMQPAENCE